ncbi:uncharacterized protein Dvar_42180 [Desulfosarcina variabilis str. Montpellier]
MLIFMVCVVLGCSTVVSDISVFHQLKIAHVPVTYLFLPFEFQEDTFEYIVYKEEVRSALLSHNYVEVDDPALAEMLVVFDYGIDNGEAFLLSIPEFGQDGVLSSTADHITSTPTGAVDPNENSRLFRLTIFNHEAAKNKKPYVAYRASVKIRGGPSRLSVIMPEVIKALFKDFPGESGSVRQETIQMQ